MSKLIPNPIFSLYARNGFESIRYNYALKILFTQ